MKIKTIYNILSAVTAASALMLMASTASATQSKWCSDGKPVKFAGAMWPSRDFETNLAAAIFSRGYGCTTEMVPGSTAITEAALVSGDLDLWVEQWGITGRTDIIKQGLKEGKIKMVGELLQGGAVEGWFVPDYVVHGDTARGIKASAPDLKTIRDLPKYASVFPDEEDPSKGRFINCPVGWDCEKTNNQLFKPKAYNLSPTYVNFHPGSAGALDAVIASAFERGKPILTYYWSPASLMGQYKFFQLKADDYSDKCWASVQVSTEGEAGTANSDDVCASAYPTTFLKTGVKTEFAKAAPELIQVLEKMTFTGDQLNKVLAEMNSKQVTGVDMATSFLKSDAAIWKTWVPADVAAKIEASLK